MPRSDLSPAAPGPKTPHFTDNSAFSDDRSPAQRFGDLITELALEAGFPVTSGKGGQRQFADAVGMSPSSVSRMLLGKTLPAPHQLEGIARTVNTDVRDLLVISGVISGESWPKGAYSEVPSAEAAADMWGISDPGIRGMLVSSVQQAILLQRQADSRSDAGEESAGRR